MSQPGQRVRSSGIPSRLMWRLILAFMVALVVCGVFFVLSQTTNKLTLVNDSAEPRTVEQVKVGTYLNSTDREPGKWLSPALLVKDHVMPPQTRLTLTFSRRPHCHVIVVTDGTSIESGMRTVTTTGPSWGNRWTIGWDANMASTAKGESSTLRKWFDSTGSWLPLPTSWRE